MYDIYTKQLNAALAAPVAKEKFSVQTKFQHK